MDERNLGLTIRLQLRWWFSVAAYIGFWLLYFNVIADAASDKYVDGRITAIERVATWLVKHAIVIEVTPIL